MPAQDSIFCSGARAQSYGDDVLIPPQSASQFGQGFRKRQVQQAIHAAHGSFVIEPALSNVQGADRLAGEKIIKGSLAESIRSVLLITAVLAASAAAAGTLLPRGLT